MADGLVAADGLAELHPFLGVGPGVLHRSGGDAQGHGGHLDLLHIQPWAGQLGPTLVPALIAAHDVVGGHLHVVEGDIGGHRSLEAHGVLGLDGHPRLSGRNQHERQVVIAIAGGVRVDQGVYVVGVGGARAEPLGPVDPHHVAIAYRGGGNAGQIGAHVGLGQPVGEQHLPSGHLGQPRLALVFAGRLYQVHARVAGTVDVAAAQGGAAAAQLLNHDHGGGDVPARPAVVLGDGDSEQSEVGQFVEHAPVDLVGAVPLPGQLPGHLRLDEATDGLPQQPVVLGFLGVVH